jgi:hypothetical protein
MIARLRPPDAACSAALLLLVLLAPPVKHTMERTMTMQMLIQIPLLVIVGLLLTRALPARASSVIDDWNYRGISGLVLVTFTSAFWMLPSALDAALSSPQVAIAKYLSVPLLIGLPLALSWSRMSFIVKGMLLLECIATLFRLGWLYLIWPERLCNVYLLDDQRRLGQLLLLIGAALFLALAWKLLWGRFDSLADAGVTPTRTQPEARLLPHRIDS